MASPPGLWIPRHSLLAPASKLAGRPQMPGSGSRATSGSMGRSSLASEVCPSYGEVPSIPSGLPLVGICGGGKGGLPPRAFHPAPCGEEWDGFLPCPSLTAREEVLHSRQASSHRAVWVGPVHWGLQMSWHHRHDILGLTSCVQRTCSHFCPRQRVTDSDAP